jgi:dihydroneopterin aldolase/2-amino-4-hydroxy-6-hydroxymethyldihydropteridine diphosphokinase
VHEVSGTTTEDWESSPGGRAWVDHDDAGAGGPDRIRIRGISATGHHGVFEHERLDGQTFVADVVLHVDTRPAAAEDRLDLTVDYGAVASGVAAVLSGEPVDLIETVAERVAAVVLEHAGVAAVDVVLHKPQAPIPVPFADVTVEIHRSRTRPPVVGRRSGRHAAAPDAVVGGPPFATVAVVGPPPPPVAVADVLAGFEVPGVQDDTGPLDLPEPVAAPSTGGAEPEDHLDVPPPEPVEVVLALGSNLGASEQILREVLHELAALDGLELTAVSPLVRTAPVGGPEQPDYLNAVVIGRTTLAPRALLRACQTVEAGHGRERLVRWGPRTVDIDIVVHGSTLAVTDDLELPHPRAHERAFVLQPWAEIAPDAVLPGLGGGPVAALARTAPDRDGIRWMALDWWAAPEAG